MHGADTAFGVAERFGVRRLGRKGSVVLLKAPPQQLSRGGSSMAGPGGSSSGAQASGGGLGVWRGYAASPTFDQHQQQ